MDFGIYASDPKWAMHPGLVESREMSLLGAVKMHEEWDSKADGRIKFWFSARTPGELENYRIILRTCINIDVLHRLRRFIKRDGHYIKRKGHPHNYALR